MRISQFDGRRVGVWGAGREGAAAVRALAQRGHADIPVATDQPLTAAELARLDGLPAGPLAGREGMETLAACDAVIRSPGISLYRPEYRELAEAGVALTTGTNLWFAEHADDLVIAVTGTKGKSTTASLIAHLLAGVGRLPALVGNVGEPLIAYLDPAEPPDVWVCELSSYQTADLVHAPRIAVVLNLHREHLDWHGTEERYFADKLRLLRLEPAPHAVLNADDPRLRAAGQELADVTWFGSAGRFAVRDGELRDGEQVLTTPDGLPLRGLHNLANLAAALTALALVDVEIADPVAALADFEPLAHRLQVVAEGERLFVNDSIATTPQATLAALDAFDGHRIALLVGGHDREQDYGELAEELARRENVVAVIGLPGNGERILEAIRAAAERAGRSPRLEAVASLEEAVDQAVEAGDEGSVVLLSPAAPSFGSFENFEARGEAFARAVSARALRRPRTA